MQKIFEIEQEVPEICWFKRSEMILLCETKKEEKIPLCPLTPLSHLYLLWEIAFVYYVCLCHVALGHFRPKSGA